MHTAFKFLRQSGVSRTDQATAITRRIALRVPVKRGASNDVAVNKRVVTSTRDDCNGGFRSTPGDICQLCSAPESRYDEVICPCTADRNAVVGCKHGYDRNPLCLSRAAALAECAARGPTPPINATEYHRVVTTSPNVIQHATTSQLLENYFTSTSPNTTKLANHNMNQLSGESLANVALSAGSLLLLVTVLGVVRLRKRCRKRRRRQQLQGNSSHSSSDRSSDALPLRDVLVEPSNEDSLIQNLHMKPSNKEKKVLSALPVIAVSETRCCSMLFETSALLQGLADRYGKTILVNSKQIPDTEAADG